MPNSAAALRSLRDEWDQNASHLDEVTGVALKLRVRLSAVLAGEPDPYPDDDVEDEDGAPVPFGVLSGDKTAPTFLPAPSEGRPEGAAT